MPFQKGVSGNPGGKPKDKPFTEAILLVATRLANGERHQYPKGSWPSIAQAMLLGAAAGDTAKATLLVNRMEGLPLQQVSSENLHLTADLKTWMSWLFNPETLESMRPKALQHDSNMDKEHVVNQIDGKPQAD